jgi:uncharacterized membrane protein
LFIGGARTRWAPKHTPRAANGTCEAGAAYDASMLPGWLLDGALVLSAFGVALALRPWRALPISGLPWPWLACWAALPLLWSADRLGTSALAQPLAGSCLLMLMAGWPLAMLALPPAALAVALMAPMPWDEALHRLAWLGVVPATLAMALGAAIRRWLPNHLFVYILGRGFFATAAAGMAAGALSVALRGASVGTDPADLMLARVLVAWGDAFITGMLAAIFVAFRPHWLATYTDRLYLPR